MNRGHIRDTALAEEGSKTVEQVHIDAGSPAEDCLTVSWFSLGP